MSVLIEQICRPGGVPSSDPQFCEQLIFPPPPDFTIQVLAGIQLNHFWDHRNGTVITT